MATGYKGIINKSILTKKCYSMYCEYCDVEFMIKVKSPPTRKKHTCGKWATQRCSGYAWTQKSEDCVKRKVFNYYRDGMNKDQAEGFYAESIKASNHHINSVGGADHYKPMVPNMEFMVKNGYATPNLDGISSETIKERKEFVNRHAGKKFNKKRSNNRQTIE